MFSLTVTGPRGREMRAIRPDGSLVALAVTLKTGEIFQCFPPELRGAVFPSAEIWQAATRDQLTRERKARGARLHRAKKNAAAAQKTLREMKRVDPHLTHNARAADLRWLLDIYGEMAEDARRLYWRADRAKKDLRRALDAVRDPLEGFVGDP
jgi:hypothetical protein